MPRIWQTTEKLLSEWNELKSVLSILLIVSTLLGLVFLQMEERRLGYSILKTSRAYKAKLDERRALEIRLAQATRLEKLESMALSRLTLKRAQSYQVIYLNDAGEIEAPPVLLNPKRSGQKLSQDNSPAKASGRNSEKTDKKAEETQKIARKPFKISAFFVSSADGVRP